VRLVHALLAVAIGTALVAGATAYAGSREGAARKQRIAIDIVGNEKTDTATFTVKPLTLGPIESDKGTATFGGAGGGSFMRNGMRVDNAGTGVELDGRRGTLQLGQVFDQNKMQNGVWVAVGIWRIEKGTGMYFGVTGGGRYVHAEMPNGRRFVRQEGWVTVTG
jgi:hypothetical protein